MPQPKVNKYETSVILGEEYTDEQTGISGIATAITFFQHACERVVIEHVKDGEIKDYVFDAPRLVHADTGQEVTSPKTGGDRPMPAARTTGQR